MRLQRADEVPVNHADIVFAYSRTRAVFIVAILRSAASGLVIVSARTQTWLGYYGAGGVGLLIYWKMISARFRSSNWLVRLNDEGLFIQFRSYLNCHFPVDDQLTSAMAGERDIVLATARVGSARPSTRYRHFPVRLSASHRLRIEWNVVPAIEFILERLTRYTSVRPEERSVRDFVNLDRLARAEQEAKLLELMEAGDTVGAISVARRLYGYDMAQAKDFVEGLGRKTT